MERLSLGAWLDSMQAQRLATGYSSNLIPLEEFTIKLYRPLEVKPVVDIT